MRQQPTLSEWMKVPTRIRAAIRGVDLDARGREGWTIRETVHHVIEANLIAGNMIIAAMAEDGQEFDWTWVNPNKSWMRRLGYDTASVEPAIAMLRALTRHIAELIAQKPAAMKRTVSLNDAPGAPRYLRTIEEIIREQIEHAESHLAAAPTRRG